MGLRLEEENLSRILYQFVTKPDRKQGYFKCVTIRALQVKREITLEDLAAIVNNLRHIGVSIHDIGFHAHGKYHQLHAHLLVSGYVAPTWINGFLIHTSRLRTSPAKYWKYIHADDWDNVYKLDQVLISNTAHYHNLCL